MPKRRDWYPIDNFPHTNGEFCRCNPSRTGFTEFLHNPVITDHSRLLPGPEWKWWFKEFKIELDISPMKEFFEMTKVILKAGKRIVEDIRIRKVMGYDNAVDAKFRDIDGGSQG